MMSLLRIVLGVLIGVGFLVGLGFIGGKFPAGAARIWFMFLGFGIGGSLVGLVIRDVRIGVTGGRFTRYERSVSPVHFWSYIFFYSLLGVVLLAVGTCSILAPNLCP
jgi:hypothetical protein